MASTKTAISRPDHQRGTPAGCLFVFFGMFLTVGLIFLYMLLIRPAIRTLQAQGWPSTACTVVGSELQTHSDSDGTSYRIEITYDYEVDGAKYQSNRYDFVDMASSGRKGKLAIVKKYPVGSKTVCYYNPDAPAEAVLSRTVRSEWWWGLFPIPFVAIGGGGICYLLFRGRFSRRSDESDPFARAGDSDYASPTAVKTSSNLPPPVSTRPVSVRPDRSQKSEGSNTAGAMLLEPEVSPVARFAGLLVISILWNGFVSIFVYTIFSKDFSWFLLLFMTPFVLVGLALLFGLAQSFLKLFNPRPRLIVGTGNLCLGQSTEVRWEMHGKVSSIRLLTLSLVGQEQATYSRGTSTYTDEETFYEEVFGSCDEPHQMGGGSATLTIPADSMHSFSSENNRIEWSLRVKADIAFWPDVDAAFTLEVGPMPQTRN